MSKTFVGKIRYPVLTSQMCYNTASQRNQGCGGSKLLWNSWSPQPWESREKDKLGQEAEWLFREYLICLEPGPVY